MASHPKLAKIAARKLGRQGVQIEAVSGAVSLGVFNTAAAKRATKQQDKRIQDATKQAKRIGWLGKATERAKLLYRTGAVPRAAYAHTAVGASPAQRKKADAIAKKAAGNSGRQPCTASMLKTRLGPIERVMPEIFLQVQQLKAWMEVWENLKEQGEARCKEAMVAWRQGLQT